MADIFSILSTSYKTAPTPSSSHTKYVPVDPTHYNGTWKGTYSTGEKLESALVKRLKKTIPDVQIVRIGREGEHRLAGLPVFDARSLFCYADLVISGGRSHAVVRKRIGRHEGGGSDTYGCGIG